MEDKSQIGISSTKLSYQGHCDLGRFIRFHGCHKVEKMMEKEIKVFIMIR